MSEGSVALAPEKLGRPLPDDANARSESCCVARGAGSGSRRVVGGAGRRSGAAWAMARLGRARLAAALAGNTRQIEGRWQMAPGAAARLPACRRGCVALVGVPQGRVAAALAHPVPLAPSGAPARACERRLQRAILSLRGPRRARRRPWRVARRDAWQGCQRVMRCAPSRGKSRPYDARPGLPRVVLGRSDLDAWRLATHTNVTSGLWYWDDGTADRPQC